MLEIRTSTEFILEHLPVSPQKSCVTLKLTQTNPDAKLDSFAYFVIVFCQTIHLTIVELHYSYQLQLTYSLCRFPFEVLIA